MSEFVYRIFGLLHRTAKTILGRSQLSSGKVWSYCIHSGADKLLAPGLWRVFVEKSVILSSDFEGLHYAGYIADSREWCLPSWIWTNAACVRMYCTMGELEKAKSLCEKLISYQQACGGWIVRNDYDAKGAIPVLAPNDSAYLANNAILAMYEASKLDRYLYIAEQCADWIMSTSRPDGLLYTGFNVRDEKWDKNNIIVDTGFAAGLFAHLVELTGKEKYKSFLERFINRYVELFFIDDKDGFCTSIDKNNKQQGGMFARGQAWALEGLLPAYKVLKSDILKSIIDRTVYNLIKQQGSNGGWAYNLTRKLMGEDCKAVPVIAKNLMEWYYYSGDRRIYESANRAFGWCCAHTAIEGAGTGGIFSYSTEGAIVKELYTSCAFVYASAYAIELERQLKDDLHNID